MDHLQSPKNPSFLPLEIPYLGLSYSEDSCVHARSGLCTTCQSDVSCRGWTGFPARMGYNGANYGYLSRSSDVDQELPGNPAALLQAWLYFGILTFFFDDVEMIPSFLQQKDDGATIINTSSLPGRLLFWRNGLDAMSAEAKSSALDRLDLVFGQLDNLCLIYLAADGLIEGFTCLVSEEVSLSIQILAESLNHAVFMADRSRGLNFYMFGSGKTPLLVKRLKKNFWCPRQIEALGRICLTYYASLMAPRYYPDISRKYDIPHEHCKDERPCRELDIDEETYKTKHVEEHREDVRCEDVPVPLVEICNILDNYEIPIVSWSDKRVQVMSSGPNGNLCSKKEPYVAISHVWADGLGNPHGNSLPRCQMELITKRITDAFASEQGTSKSLWFWMDTLCVPAVGDKERRKRAIGMMNQTYKEATGTLVLDAELMQRSRNGSTDIEVALWIVFSRWAQRLWTLQEVVASRLSLFQFADGCINSTELKAALTRYAIDDPLLIRAYKWFQDVQKLHEATNPDELLLRTFQLTPERNTSKKSDEVICVAQLVQFNQEQMKRLQNVTSDAQRVGTFFQMLGKAPRDLLFGEPRISNADGFGWCPENLLTAFRRLSSNTAKAVFHTVTLEGQLKGKWNAIRFPAPPANDLRNPEIDQEFFILNDMEQGCRHLVGPIYSTAVEALSSEIQPMNLALLLQELGLYESDNACLVEVVKVVREDGSVDVTHARRIGDCNLRRNVDTEGERNDNMLVIDIEGETRAGTWCIE